LKQPGAQWLKRLIEEGGSVRSAAGASDGRINSDSHNPVNNASAATAASGSDPVNAAPVDQSRSSASLSPAATAPAPSNTVVVGTGGGGGGGGGGGAINTCQLCDCRLTAVALMDQKMWTNCPLQGCGHPVKLHPGTVRHLQR
jgi:hypothetical protein